MTYKCTERYSLRWPKYSPIRKQFRVSDSAPPPPEELHAVAGYGTLDSSPFFVNLRESLETNQRRLREDSFKGSRGQLKCYLYAVPFSSQQLSSKHRPRSEIDVSCSLFTGFPRMARNSRRSGWRCLLVHTKGVSALRFIELQYTVF